MRVYFAAPLFSEAELEFNQRLTAELEDEGHEVFLPQRDGIEIEELYDREDVDGVSDVMQEIYEIDRQAIYQADLLTALLDGQVPDEGVAVEMGIASENDTPIIALKTDRRVFSEDEPINAMLWGAMDEYVESREALVEAVNRRAE
ncbi:MAG: nucleoside 2-deoxyribosyltransferase [Halobacteriaceae archaeon]